MLSRESAVIAACPVHALVTSSGDRTLLGVLRLLGVVLAQLLNGCPDQAGRARAPEECSR